MKFVNSGKKLNFVVVAFCLGAQLSVVASALLTRSGGRLVDLCARPVVRIPGRVAQRLYKTAPTTTRQPIPTTTVKLEPTFEANRYKPDPSMMTRRLGMGGILSSGRVTKQMVNRRLYSSNARSLTMIDQEKFDSLIKNRDPKKQLNLSYTDFSKVKKFPSDLTKA